MQDYVKMLQSIIGEESLQCPVEMLADIAYALDQSAIVAITDRAGKITYVNDLFCEISQYTAEELIGSTHRKVNSGYHSPSFFRDMWSTITRGDIWQGEIRNRAKDGTHYWVDTKIIPITRETGSSPVQYIAFRYDITERKTMEQSMLDNAELYRLITENASDFIAVIDQHGRFQYVSPSFDKLLGYPLSLHEDTLYSFVQKKDHGLIERLLEMLAEDTQPDETELQISGRGDCSLVMKVSVNPIREPGRYFQHWVVAMQDVTKRKETENLIQSLEHTDQLTSLYNRISFRQQLLNKVETCKKTGSTFSLVHLNIDRLRYVNESFGHEKGDYVLSVIAKRLQQHVGAENLLGRISGDEFAFTLTGSVNQAEEMTHRIKEVVEAPIHIDNRTYSLSTSYGIASFPEHAGNASELVKNAEKALHFVKEMGGSALKVYESGTETKTLERILLESELRKSVQRGYFTLEYQPKMNLERGELIGVEALVRWDHPELGRISPDRFIPLAEESRLIIPLGEWILQEACKQAKAWQEAGYPPVRVAINMSTVQLEDPETVDRIKKVLRETGVEPELIEIEVTESSFADKIFMKETLQAIRSLGITVAIDDFGTGYSNFSYIQELPADTIKIDMSFIRDIDVNENNRAIVKAIVTIAETAGLRVIAEGIETEEQARILLELGCQEGQGYFYSRPLPAEDCSLMMSL
ncbi:EAL domain-containing protein [Sporosarcina cyprini]|uniref:sensor domain-containing protein n=1 Tax=Sporosarcina cyprini TaxID=2910523 RepID=UPI001EDE7119|nr:EAL domain-containing protein [Sporosarcina cyprini]MCG3089864.1 EAL domain-containing protein [Sporosarcina cyprini]